MILKSTIGIVSPFGVYNYVKNPSAEIDDYYNAVGTANITLTTSFQKYGLQSYEVEALAGGDGIELDLEATGGATHYFTARIKRSAGISLTFVLDGVSKPAVLLEKIDTEWNLFGAFYSGGNGATLAQILADSPATIWIDGVQVEPDVPNVKYTTYCDGTQEGCRWLGAPNASMSIRSNDSRAGGIVKSFWEGYGFFPEKALGMGTAVEELNIDSYAFLPGGEINSSKIPPREFSIIGYFLGDTVEELHEQAQALELELGLDTYPGRQPIRLRYFGAKVQKEIKANYAGGLEGDLPIFYNDDNSVEDEHWTKNFKFKMRASIQFVATDPFWYEVGESATLLDTNESANFRTIYARLLDDPTWDNLGPPGTGGGASYTSTYAIAEDGQYVYIGGTFSNWNGIANADNIVRYEKATGTYLAMDTGLTGASNKVNSIVVAPNGDVIVAGSFVAASGVAEANYIAVWAVGATSFTALGDPDSGGAAIQEVLEVFFDPTGILWIGGIFTNWAGVANGDNIITWDGSNYVAPAVGADDAVSSFAHDGTYLYVAGSYSNIGGNAIEGIASWDGSDYAQVGDGIPAQSVRDVVVWNNRVVIGHSLSPFVSILQGQLWTALGGTGTDGEVLKLGTGPDGYLFVAGLFTLAGTLPATNIVRFNGYTFAHLDIQLPDSNVVQTIVPSRYDIDPLINKNYTLYLGAGSSLPAFYSGLEAVQNEGTISAFPKIVFYRSGGDEAIIQTLRNERTGRELLFNYALLDGESLTIDLNPKNRTITSSFFGPRMNARLPNDDFSTWQLLPGDNPISSFVSEDGSPDIIAYILFREPYKGWN